MGDNPYMRMTRAVYGDECKVCSRPFTVFRWCPGQGMRFKKTEICQVCAKSKNVCQTCILDIKYNVPVKVRDSITKEAEAPKTEINRQFYHQQLTDKPLPVLAPKDQETLERISNREPNYKRNLPHVCTFYLKGKCNRGSTCPYRHSIEGASDVKHNKNDIKDRFYGTKDPAAQKILNEIEYKGEESVLEIDTDKESTTGSITKRPKKLKNSETGPIKLGVIDPKHRYPTQES